MGQVARAITSSGRTSSISRASAAIGLGLVVPAEVEIRDVQDAGEQGPSLSPLRTRSNGA